MDTTTDLIRNLKNVYDPYIPGLSIPQHAAIQRMEGDFLLMQHMVTGPRIDLVYQALRVYEAAGKRLLENIGAGAIFATDSLCNIYEGIAGCCKELGDIKHARAFDKKALRTRGVNTGIDISEGLRNIEQKYQGCHHRRSVSINLGKSCCCNPECNHIGATKPCARCHGVRYCSQQCQRVHFPLHKSCCKQYHKQKEKHPT